MIHLNIGSNLESKFGSRFENISTAISLLINCKLKINKISSYYETPSYPNKTMPRFLNVCLSANYVHNEIELMNKILIIEKKIGRIKSKKNYPRVCDIDIIDFNGLVTNEKLNIPHPRMHERNFVLLPLFEIEKDWVHPIKKTNIKKLILSLSNKDIRSIKQI